MHPFELLLKHARQNVCELAGFARIRAMMCYVFTFISSKPSAASDDYLSDGIRAEPDGSKVVFPWSQMPRLSALLHVIHANDAS